MSESDEPTRAIPPVSDPTQAMPAAGAAAAPQWVVDPGVPGTAGGGPTTPADPAGEMTATGVDLRPTAIRRCGGRPWASWSSCWP